MPTSPQPPELDAVQERPQASATRGDSAPGQIPQARGAVIFMVLFVLTLALLTGGYATWIRFVDPYGEYGAGRFPVVVMDSRHDKMRQFEQSPARASITGLILGSSRSLLLRPAILDRAMGQQVFNFAVDNAHAEDELAIYRWAVRHGAPIRVLVIGLDVVALNPDDVPDHMFQRIDALKDAIADPHAATQTDPFRAVFSDSVERWKRPFTVDYLKDSFKSVAMAAGNTRPTRGFDADGYLNAGKPGVPLPDYVFDADRPITDEVATYMQRLGGMKELSPKRRGYLNELLSESSARGVRTIIWLTPVHPRLMQALANTNYPQLLNDCRAYLRELHERFGATVYDFTDPASFGGNGVDWGDTTHMSIRNMDRVAQEIGKGSR